MTNPVLTRNTTVLRGAGATVQSIALITLLYLGFVVSAAMRLFADYEMVTRAVEMGVDAKYEPYYAFALRFFLLSALKRPNLLANIGAERTSKPGLSI